jgi:hypothetical protein
MNFFAAAEITGARRDLVNLLSQHHGRVVSACVGHFHTLDTRGRKLVPILSVLLSEEIQHFEPEFIAANQQAYDRAAVEMKICQRMNDGHMKLLWREGLLTSRGLSRVRWKMAWCIFMNLSEKRQSRHV